MVAWVEAVVAAFSVSSVVVLVAGVVRRLQFAGISWIQARSSHQGVGAPVFFLLTILDHVQLGGPPGESSRGR